MSTGHSGTPLHHKLGNSLEDAFKNLYLDDGYEPLKIPFDDETLTRAYIDYSGQHNSMFSPNNSTKPSKKEYALILIPEDPMEDEVKVRVQFIVDMCFKHGSIVGQVTGPAYLKGKLAVELIKRGYVVDVIAQYDYIKNYYESGVKYQEVIPLDVKIPILTCKSISALAAWCKVHFNDADAQMIKKATKSKVFISELSQLEDKIPNKSHDTTGLEEAEQIAKQVAEVFKAKKKNRRGGKRKKGFEDYISKTDKVMAEDLEIADTTGLDTAAKDNIYFI